MMSKGKIGKITNSSLVTISLVLLLFPINGTSSGDKIKNDKIGGSEKLLVVLSDDVIKNDTSTESGNLYSTGDPSPVTVNPHLEELDEKYSKCGGIDIREMSVLDIQNLYASNQLTTLELTKCYLERLDRMNDVLRVVVEINPDVLNDAMRLDAEREQGKNIGPMHGIPVLLKDSIATLDKTETTVGSPAFIGIRPKREADVVTTLRSNGALILGKSHCQEFYGFRGTNIPSGWSGRGGQSRNPYNLSITPEGSSSGSGIGVAANLVPVAVGSETDGSILAPASIVGITGMKPTFGLPSVKGAIPVSYNQDHLGPMAKTVFDTAILLDAMISESERPQHHPASYAQNLLENGTTRRLRVGILRYPFWDTTVLNSANLEFQLPQLEKMVQVMKDSLDFVVIDPIETPLRNISVAKLFIMLYHDFKHGIDEYLKNDVENQYPRPRPQNPFPQTPDAYISVIAPTKRIASLQDIIDYIKEHPNPHGYNQEHLLNSQATDGLLNQTYIEARDSNRNATKEYLEAMFQQYNLDAVVTPSESRYEGIIKDDMKDFPAFGYSMACMAGYPSINIPAGIGLNEVPFGITFIAKPYDEPTLLQIAYAAEQMNPQRRTPQFQI